MQKEGKTMIKYKLDVQEELKKKGYTSCIIKTVKGEQQKEKEI